MTFAHRSLRNQIRNLDGYRALSDAIKADIDFAAPKTIDEAATLGLEDLNAAYLGWVRVKREAVRAILWHEAARVIACADADGIAHINSAIYGAALALRNTPEAWKAAKALLNPAQPEADEQDDDEQDDDAADEEIWS